MGKDSVSNNRSIMSYDLFNLHMWQSTTPGFSGESLIVDNSYGTIFAVFGVIFIFSVGALWLLLQARINKAVTEMSQVTKGLRAPITT